MSRIQRGMEALVARQKVGATTSNVVTYKRVVGGEVDLTGIAWVGRTAFSRLPKDPGGGSVVWGDRDYLVPVADLMIDGLLFEPERGDRIAETIAGTEVTFEILAPLNEPAWRYSDSTRLMFRLHCKETAVS